MCMDLIANIKISVNMQTALATNYNVYVTKHILLLMYTFELLMD